MLSLSWVAHTQAPAGATRQRSAARAFLSRRSLAATSTGQRRRSSAEALAYAREQRSRLAIRPASLPPSAPGTSGLPLAPHGATPQTQLPPNISTTWASVGPAQILTSSYGPVTGRITSVAVDPADATGNTVYIGTTGGGVWKSINAAGPAANVTFTPVTDYASGSGTGISSLSIGAVSVQPSAQSGAQGVVLAGTGDPNDALDSYYGSGILRSTDQGATWHTIVNANLHDGPNPSFSFYGMGFSGFAWSTTQPATVVAAVTQAYDGSVVNALQPNSVEGIYYSNDAGASWFMATLTDGPGLTFQSPSTIARGAPGNAVTSVLWNPFRQAFYAAIRYHGYYESQDGITWKRLANQPGPGLTPSNCRANPNSTGSVSCPIFRGTLALQPVTGDMFALTVDANLADQGLWQDVCAAATNATCAAANHTVAFTKQIPDGDLEDGNGNIPQADYNLWLAAVPAQADTLLYAGTLDIFKRSLAAANLPWRNATNVLTCGAAKVAPAQHAVAVGASGSLLFFGNDGGLWRTTDGLAQSPTACTADDAAHLDNLNSGLGSLAQVTSLAQSTTSPTTLLGGFGVNGSAATITGQGAWTQVLDGLGSFVAIDPANSQNWYAAAGYGVDINACSNGAACTPASFPVTPLIGDAQTAGDGQSLGEPAAWMLDPQDPSRMLVGTCRLWRGSIAGGTANWSSANAISPVLDFGNDPDCTAGAGQIQSIAASGTVTGTNAGAESELLYVGMEGIPGAGGDLPYGGLVSGHIFTATVSPAQSGAAAWADITEPPSTVVNDFANQGQFNPGGFGINALAVDPHDATGQTLYAGIQGFSGNGISEPLVYRSTDQGASWTNITANLPVAPVNAILVDPGDANTVYVASDAGVYATSAVATCSTGPEQCWAPYGAGLPPAPVTTLITQGTAGQSLLLAGTYGRGVYEMLLASAVAANQNGTTAVLLSPPALTFGAQAQGGPGTSSSITVTNTGAVPLLIRTVSATGDFTEQDACTSAPVAVGQSCIVTVTFAPTSSGSRSGVLTLYANVPGGQVTAALSGTGLAAGQLVLAPLQLTFGGIPIGTAAHVQYLTLSNTGGSPVSLQSPAITGDYQITATSCGTSLDPGVGCTIGIVFQPKSSGPDNGSLSIVTASGTFTAALSGSGLSPAADAVSPASLTFGQQVVNTASAPQAVTLANTGDQPLTLVSVLPSTSDFAADASACANNLPGHASCVIQVSFTPQALGARTASLAVSDALHSGSSALSVGLSGTGIAPAGVLSLSPASLDFGAEGVPLTPPLTPAQSVTLTNNGTVAVQGLSLTVTGDYAVAPGTCGNTLAAGAACTASVSFAPTQDGIRTGLLQVTGSNLPQPLSTSLTGVGLDFTISVSGSATATVVSGTPANFQVNLVPATGSSGLLTLTCTSAPALPSGSSCNLPSSVQLASGTDQSVSVTVQTPSLTTSLLHTLDRNRWALACLALPLFCWPRRRHHTRRPAIGFLVFGCLALAGCGLTVKGGGVSTGGTGKTGGGIGSNYTLTLTASAPGIQQSVNVTLVLEQ